MGTTAGRVRRRNGEVLQLKPVKIAFWLMAYTAKNSVDIAAKGKQAASLLAVT